MTDPAPFRLPLVAILRGITPDESVAHVGELVDEGYDAIEIVDGKRPRRHVGLVNDVAVLLNGHFGVATGNTAHGRRKAFQAVGQHIVVRDYLRAAKAERIKHV